MKHAVASLALALAAALLTGCAGHTHIGGLSRDERAGIVRADSSCDSAGGDAYSDPASPCFVSRRGAKE